MSFKDQSINDKRANISNDGVNTDQGKNLESTESDDRANTITADFGSLTECGCTPVCPICPTENTANTPWAYIRRNSDQTLTPNESVVWENIFSSSADITISGTSIIIVPNGIYLIQAFINYNGASSFVLELNGTEQTPQTLYSQNDGTTMTILLKVCAAPPSTSSTLKLKTKNNKALNSDTIGSQDSVSAGITIFKIDNAVCP